MEPARAGSPEPAPGGTAEGSPLLDLVWAVVERRWTVLLVAAQVVLLAVVYLFLATPSYRSDAVVQVEERARGLAGLSDLSAMLGEKSPAETEIAIIRSRMSLGRVVDDLGLDRSATPRRFPVIGGAIARRYRGERPAPAWFGLRSYGWGGDHIDLQRLDVPPRLMDEPLILTALHDNRFRVTSRDGTPVLEGEVGRAARGSLGPDKVEVYVADLVARPGTQFILERKRRSEVVASYQEQLKIFEDGKKSGILVLSLDGPDPVAISNILNAIANAYLRQNVERKSAEASNALEFLESQLPVVKENLAAAESALNAFQVGTGSVDISKATQTVLDRAVVIERTLSELEMQRSELLQRFTASHPSVAALNEKMAKLRSERNAINARMRDIPEAEIDSARLLRDVKVNNELYTLLLNKAQELRVVKSGTVGNVRILDEAVPARKPQRPQPLQVLVLAVALGLLAGVVAAVVRRAFDQGLADAEEVESRAGLAVYATIPHSARHVELEKTPSAAGSTARLLAAADPQDSAVEALRSLRTSLQFALLEAPNNVITVGGPTPGVGKSFVCANLAALLGNDTDRVLLVDADLRRGRIHRYFGMKRKPGLCDVLGGSVPLNAAVRPTDLPQLDVLSTGSIPPNPTELLSSHRFEQVVAWASARYRYVLIDTPPALAVTDPALVARIAGVNLLVLKAGRHPPRELALTVKRYVQAGATVQGAVLNDVREVRGRYGRHGRYQRYDYRSSRDES
jgi:tyrosine-protein kinase Etk/Wzc